MICLLELRIFFRIVAFTSFVPLVLSQDFPLHRPGKALEELALHYPHLQNFNIENLKRDLSKNPTLIQRTGLSHGTLFSDLVQYKNAPESVYDQLFENLTASCANQIKYTVEAVKGLPLLPETWVLQMLDAWGKLPSGILSGHIASVGDFEECLQIKGEYNSGEEPGFVGEVKGKYCTTYLFPGSKLTELGSSERIVALLQNMHPGLQEAVSLELLLQYLFQPTLPAMLPSLGTCFPASCSTGDVQQFLESYHKYVSQEWVSQLVEVCYTDEKPPLKAAEWVMIVILAGIAFLCIIGTILDVYGQDNLKKSTGMKVFLAFSFYTNTRNWLNTKVGTDNFTCLNGIRFLTSAWILLCHNFASTSQTLKWNNVDIKHIYKNWTVYPILNGSLSVDTFFLMSGFLVGYNLLKMLDKTKGKFNYFLFVLHRYLRLTPVVAILVGIMATIWPYFSTGYYWYEIDMTKDDCKAHWWRSLLYINNLFEPGKVSCFNLSWYLNVDMQLFILSPLAIIPLWKWKKLGMAFLVVLSVIGIGARTFVIAYFHQVPTTVVTVPGKKMTYWEDYYQKPWVRFDVYIVGIALGYIFYLKGKQTSLFRNISKIIILIGWTLSTIFALASIYIVMYYSDPKNVDETLKSAHAAAYGGLHRFAWALSIAWIIFACVNGYGGWANKILSLKIFIPLGRLSYTLYLVQFIILNTHYSKKLHPDHFSQYSAVVEYLGLLLVTGFAAYILVMCIEVPFMLLTKMILPTNAPPKKPKEKVETSEDVNGNKATMKNDNV